MCAQLVVYPQRRPIFSTTQLGWLPMPYYTQQNTGLLRGGLRYLYVSCLQFFFCTFEIKLEVPWIS